MKKIILFIALASLSLQIRAQQSHTTSDTTHHKIQGSFGDPNADINIDEPTNDSKVSADNQNMIFVAVEQEPHFTGGPVALNKFIHENLKNPNNVLGRIIATFIVEKDGSLSNIKVLRSPGDDVSAEAIRVLKLCPKWNPGIQNGHAVRVQYTIAIPLGN
jgi:protein TonB